jgi:hypothetical protein
MRRIHPIVHHCGLKDLLWLLLGTSLLSGCSPPSAPTTAPTAPKVKVAPLDQAAISFDYTSILQVPRDGGPGDPDPCLKSGTDPQEKKIGGYSTRAAYSYASAPTVLNLYAKLVYETDVCTDSTLSGKDRTLLQKILNLFGVTDARSFAATLTVTGNSQGIAYPTFIPFQYTIDEKKSTYAVSQIGKGVLPWQATIGTNTFDIHYAYNANKNLSIDTANLFSSLVTAISGAGKSATLLSPASNAYLNASQQVLDRVSKSFFTEVTSVSDIYHFDMVGTPNQWDRAVTYRFRDLGGQRLAAIRVAVVFTNSLANPVPIDPLKTPAPAPQFSNGVPDILAVPLGGTQGSLLQAISKEPSYQTLLKSTTDTTPQSFATACQNLITQLETTYGLNTYDVALTMAQILSQDTAYLTTKKFYDSVCFKSRDLLKQMGINDFDKPPPG